MKTTIPHINQETAAALGLLPEEFERIQAILGRVPNFTELAIFSAMWSEHCSYKNSIKWLKILPKDGARMLAKAGEENAGMVDVGDGLACVFKIESHNHPSALAPYQGAATGVGGINRDIFTMGARPIAQLNSLRFGDLASNRNQWLLKGVVKGIGDYGNAFGVPTVGGELFFDPSYTANPLVNALSAGIVRVSETVSAVAYGVGNLIYMVGSSTGKDGIHGASFASKDITENSENDLPAVQVGDPFQEKLLLEASMEVIQTGAVIGMQDMGAAGLICSTAEMSAKGEHGMRIALDRVPIRQHSMKPYEILLSESQERMLLVIKKGKEKEVERIFKKWDLYCSCIGEVNNSKRLQYFMDEELVADVPANDLVLGGGAPVYSRDYKEPSYFQDFKKFSMDSVQEPHDWKAVALHVITRPNIASKRWVTEQYDSMVGTATVTTNKPSDAAIVNIKGTSKAIALTIDCNARYVYADPRKGACIAVAEAARNIVCSGAEPVAITNCLNFGNPYVPEVYWQFTEAIQGIREACIQLGTPVTGGNVSFYNQSDDGGPIYPTPTIGMLGVMDHVDQFMSLDFKATGDLIFLLGASRNDISCSEYVVSYHKIKACPAPYFNMEEELALHKLIKALIKSKLVASVHDVSDGGLYVALFESAAANRLGFCIQTDRQVRKDAFLFGEAQGRVVVSVKVSKMKEFLAVTASSNVPYQQIGEVSVEEIVVDGESFGSIYEQVIINEQVLPSMLDA